MLSAFFPGLLLGLSLIVAIGAQNAFVLRQGLRGEHVLAVCLTCAVSDAVLILVGSQRLRPSQQLGTMARNGDTICRRSLPVGLRPAQFLDGRSLKQRAQAG